MQETKKLCKLDVVPGYIIDMCGSVASSRWGFKAVLILVFTCRFLLALEASLSTLSVRIAFLFGMNQSRESKTVHLTVGVFSIFT